MLLSEQWGQMELEQGTMVAQQLTFFSSSCAATPLVQGMVQ